jgi:hypothetical protein
MSEAEIEEMMKGATVMGITTEDGTTYRDNEFRYPPYEGAPKPSAPQFVSVDELHEWQTQTKLKGYEEPELGFNVWTTTYEPTYIPRSDKTKAKTKAQKQARKKNRKK